MLDIVDSIIEQEKAWTNLSKAVHVRSGFNLCKYQKAENARFCFYIFALCKSKNVINASVHSTRIHFISIDVKKWNKIANDKRKTRRSPQSILCGGNWPENVTAFSSRAFRLTRIYFAPLTVFVVQGTLSLTYEGYAKSLSRWNSKGRTPTLGFYLVSGAARRGAVGPLQMVVHGRWNKQKEGMNAHTSLLISPALSSLAVGSARCVVLRIALPIREQKGFLNKEFLYIFKKEDSGRTSNIQHDAE